MAVSVDTVYKTVLYILNKEQRGYVTPSEFSNVAEQVQQDIFKSYFADGNQQNRKNQTNSQNDTEFFNIYKDIAYKLYPFEKEIPFYYESTNDGFLESTPDGVSTLYKMGEVISIYSGQPTLQSITQLVNKKEFDKISRSRLTAPTNAYPIYYTTNTILPTETTQRLLLKIYPTPDNIFVNGLTIPARPVWAFTTGSLGQYLYDPNNSVDFELDISEQPIIITNVLKYFGVVISDPTIIQVAEQESQKVEINEKS